MNNKKWITPTVLAILLAVALIWGTGQYQMKSAYRTSLTNEYQRLFYDVKKHIENVQVALSKVLVSGSGEQDILFLSQIMNEAYFAQDKLSQMPIVHADVAKTERFLTQVADYSNSLIQNRLNGKEITSKQREALTNLQKSSAYLNDELDKLHETLIAKNFNVRKGNRVSKRQMDEANKNMIQTSLIGTEKKIAKTPELIYDGPFSEQMLNKKPRSLGNKKITRKQAENIARKFIGNKKISNITPFEQGKDAGKAVIPSYTFSILPENTPKDRAIYIGVSETGGKVVWMANPRAVSKKNMSIKEAEKRALKFLEEKGYPDMEPNYSLRYDGTVLFNFALKQDDVTIYPDLVKVKIALDNGEIVGFDSSAYLMNHHNRTISKPGITKEEAREKVRIDFDIDSIRLAMIPKGSKEVLTYEFKGKYKGADFIIYINALDGREEQILQIIKNENGTLTF